MLRNFRLEFKFDCVWVRKKLWQFLNYSWNDVEEIIIHFSPVTNRCHYNSITVEHCASPHSRELQLNFKFIIARVLIFYSTHIFELVGGLNCFFASAIKLLIVCINCKFKMHKMKLKSPPHTCMYAEYNGKNAMPY